MSQSFTLKNGSVAQVTPALGESVQIDRNYPNEPIKMLGLLKTQTTVLSSGLLSMVLQNGTTCRYDGARAHG